MRIVVFFAAALIVSADTLQEAWNLAPGSRPYLNTSNIERGMAYNPTTGHLLLVSRSANPETSAAMTIAILNASDGEHVGYMDTATGEPITGSNPANFQLNMIGVADDGAIYAANLTTGAGATPYKIYRWQNETSAPTLAYMGDPSNGLAPRWGDSFDVRGSGPNTQIIAGARASAHVAVFTTTDGLTFTNNVFAGAAGTSGSISVGFGAGNTGWSKLNSQPLHRFTFDLTTKTAVRDISVTYPVASAGLGPLSVSGKYLGIILVVGGTPPTPDFYRVYDITTPSAPVPVGEGGFPDDQANGNNVGSVDFAGQRVFFLDTNNGLVAVDIIESVTPVTITSQPVSLTGIETGIVKLTVVASGTPPLTYEWTHAGTNVGGNTATLSLTNISAADAGDYQVTVSNSAGPVTSNPATLTVQPIVRGTQLTKRWSIPAGTRWFSDSNNSERGIAYNKVSGNVLVVSRSALPVGQTAEVRVLDANTGADKHVLNYDKTIIADPRGDVAFSLNMIGVADDGAVYAANLTSDSRNTPFTVYRWPSDSPDASPEIVYLGDPSGAGNARFGDSFDVRGSGENTEILVASRNGNNVAIIFPTTDPTAFESTSIEVSDAPAGAFGLSIAFGDGNSFYGTSSSSLVRLVTYDDPTVGGPLIGAVAREYTSTEIPAAVTALAFDPASKHLAGIALANPDNVHLYKIPDVVTDAPTLVDQEVFEVENPNGNGTASLDFGGNKLFALDTNHGILAFDFSPGTNIQQPTLGAPQIAANGSVTLTVTGRAGDVFKVQAANSLTSPITWSDVGDVTIGAGGTATITDAAATGQSTRFYRAISAPTP